MKGMKFKLKPIQPNVNDIVYKLENLLQIYSESTMTHQVITSAIKEIKDLRHCMGEMDDIVDRLQNRLQKCEEHLDGLL